MDAAGEGVQAVVAERGGDGGGTGDGVEERRHGRSVDRIGERSGLCLLPLPPGHRQRVAGLRVAFGGIAEVRFEAGNAGLENFDVIALGKPAAA
jgi:hypothetical protein